MNTRKIEDIDPLFEIEAERQQRKRVVHGDEFDEVTHELMARCEILEAEVRKLLQAQTEMRIWLREATAHI